MQLPLSPGNYTLFQGIPSYLSVMVEGRTQYTDESLECYYQNEGKVGVRSRGQSFDSDPMIERFKQLPPELQEAITARFVELFALDIGIGTPGKSPRGDRCDYYKKNPLTVTVHG